MIVDLAVAIPLAIVCVLVSAFFSGTEVALFSLRRVDREQLGHSTAPIDRKILHMLERPRRLIATVLIGNESFNSFLAVLALLVVADWATSPGEAFWLALAVTLPLVVLVAEVTSKTLAAKAPLAWARVCALPLAAFAALVTPLRLVVQGVTGLLLRPLGDSVRKRPAHDLSEEEFRTLVDAGSAQGQVDARERRLIHRVFEFNDKNVGQVMTPRDRIFALSYDLPVQRLVKELATRGFSRVPIYQKSLDNVRGILNVKDLVKTAAGQPLGRPLGELLHEPLFVPRTTPVKRLFLTFKQKKVHMAIVVSEYGKVLGLVTMDDLLSQIFGLMRDERAELQNTIPPGTRVRVRTPAGGRPETADGTGVVRPVAGDATGPVPRPTAEELSGAVSVARGDDRSAPVMRPDSQPGLEVLDPPSIRPIHRVDEVTPPAIDIAELAKQDKSAEGKPS